MIKAVCDVALGKRDVGDLGLNAAANTTGLHVPTSPLELMLISSAERVHRTCNLPLFNGFMELIKATPGTRSKNLVFTSAGDHSNLRRWLEGRRDFDLWVAYYGERAGTFRQEADFYSLASGAKFQNLHSCYQSCGEVFARYDAVMVMDDDIVIDATGLTRLFEIRRELDLWVLQPAFRLSGKISWDITRVSPTNKLRYTNFVEMTCPLFRRDKLDAFMAVFDPEIAGYGEDWWFLKTLGADLEKRVAVVDEVACVNPHDREKGGTREIDRLLSHEERKAGWERLKVRHGLDERGREHKEYGTVRKSALAAAAGLVRYFPEWAHFNSKRLGRWLFR